MQRNACRQTQPKLRLCCRRELHTGNLSGVNHGATHPGHQLDLREPRQIRGRHTSQGALYSPGIPCPASRMTLCNAYTGKPSLLNCITSSETTAQACTSQPKKHP